MAKVVEHLQVAMLDRGNVGQSPAKGDNDTSRSPTGRSNTDGDSHLDQVGAIRL